MDKNEALNLIPKAYRDDRAEYFTEIVWEETQTGNFQWGEEDDKYLLRAIAAFAPNIAPYAARLPIPTQRILLRELPGLTRLAGTPYSIARTLEVFGYTAIFEENPGGNNGTFKVKIPQQFNFEEVRAIVNHFKPAGRILAGVEPTVAILLDGTRFFDGTTSL